MNLARRTLTATILIVVSSFELGAQVRLVPIAPGWSKNQVNTVVFRKNSVTSFKKYQYAAFYGEDSTVVLAKRKLGSVNWEIERTGLRGSTEDAHNSISIVVDGSGVLHLAWNTHNSRLNYAVGNSAGSLTMGMAVMTGSGEERVTYPEFYKLPDGDLLFMFRNGSSGNGDLVLNRYNSKSRKWSRVHDSLISGEGKRNAYPQTVVDRRGTIHVSWVWRETPDVATNHDLSYARSTDSGKTWTTSTGKKYKLPIIVDTAEMAWQIPQRSELINQTSMAADADGDPYIATYWRSAGSTIPQYRLVYFDGKDWKMSQVSNRTTPFSLSGSGTKRIPIARPQIVIDSTAHEQKVIVIFRDAERRSRVSAAVSTDLINDVWRTVDLDTADVGMWEPTFDGNLWDTEKELHLFVQKVGQGDGEKLEGLQPQMISILEWKP